MLSDVSQIALQQEERGQHEGNVAGACLSTRPQQQRKTDDRDAHRKQRHPLRRAVDRAAHPRPARAASPFGDDLREPRVFAGFGAERLHHRVAAHGVGQRAAKLGVPGVAEARRRRDIAKRQADGDPDIDQRAGRHDQPHHRPENSKQHGRTDQHDQRRQQRQEDRIVQEVERPHSARDLANRRSGKAVGVPVRREPLNAVKSVGADVGHHLQRQFDDAHEAEMPKHRGAQRQTYEHGKSRYCRVPDDDVGCCAACHRIDQPAGIERRQHVGQCRSQKRRHDKRKTHRLTAPVRESEAENAAERAAAQIDTKTSHGDHRRPGDAILENEATKYRDLV